MNVLEFLQAGWRPAVEILILTVGVYYLLMYIRGTRAWPIVLGILALLGVLTALTIVLKLSVIQWLLRYLFTGLALAVLVIFQPELRRLLAQLGNLPFLRSAQEERENIEVIIETAERLSEMRMGALIALQRAIQLDDCVESGVPVNCEASPEMLETIFFPNNAVHDGGVIIKGDRILRAACIFPLTQKQNLSRSLGTRHRAAIGLSEETDAVVVVVSEETGRISYAFQGELVQGLSLEQLRLFLTSVFVPSSGTPASAGPTSPPSATPASPPSSP